MSDFFDEAGPPPSAAAPPLPETDSKSEDAPPASQDDDAPDVGARSEPLESVAETRFKSCRWHETQDNGPAYCTNRDVLPFAGKNGFSAEAWCPECKLYKVKRTAKKRPIDDYDDY